MATVSTDISKKIDIECRKGDTLWILAVLETGSVGSGTYMNISSYTQTAFVVKNSNDNSVLELYQGSGTDVGVKYYETISNGGVGGSLTISATSDAMNIPEGTYTYTCKISRTGAKHTVMHGKFKVVD